MLATGDAGSSVAFNNGGEQMSGGTVGTYKGRKFVSTKDSRAAAVASAKMKIPKNVNLEDLHQAMEDDATAVDVLKREVWPVPQTTDSPFMYKQGGSPLIISPSTAV